MKKRDNIEKYLGYQFIKENADEILKYLGYQFINEGSDKSTSKSKDNNIENVKDPKGKILSGLKGMKPGAVMQAIAKSLGINAPKFLGKYLLDIFINAAKNGKVKVDALKGAVKDFNIKNVEDNSNIDWEHVEIDPAGISMKCFFDGDSKKIIDRFMKQYESEMKDVKKEIDKADKELHDDVKKAGVKIDDDKLDKNGLTVASVIDDDKNKGKSGKELTKEVEQKIEQKEEAKELLKQAKESEKKLDEIEVDPKIEKMSDEELIKAVEEEDQKNNDNNSEDSYNNLVKEIDEKITAKLGKDYKNSLLTGIYSKEELDKNAKKNKLKKVDFNNIKSNKVIGVRIDFFGDESKDVVSEVVDDKAGFIVRKVDSKEKDEGVKKIYETFSKVLKDVVGEKSEGNVVSYLKHWQGKNDDGNFDSLFFFVGLKNFKKTNESMNESGSFVGSSVSDIDMDDIAGGNIYDKIKGDGKIVWMPASIANKIIQAWQNHVGPAEAVRGGCATFIGGSTSEFTTNGTTIKSVIPIIGSDKFYKALKFARENNVIKDIDDVIDKYKEAVPQDYQEQVEKTLRKSAISAANAAIEKATEKVADSLDDKTSQKIVNKVLKNASKEVSDKMDSISLKAANIAAKSAEKTIVKGKDVVSSIKSLVGTKMSADEYVEKISKMPFKTDDDVKAATALLVKNGMSSEDAIDVMTRATEKMNIPDLDTSIESNDIEWYANNPDEANSIIDRLGKDNEVTSVVKNAANATGITSDDVAKAVATSAIGKNGEIFNYTNMTRQLNELDDVFDDGKLTPKEFAQLQSFGSRLDAFNDWAEQNKDSTNPAIQQKIALIKRMQEKYNDMLLTRHSGEVTIINGEPNTKTLERLGPSEQNSKVAMTAESDKDAQKASGGWKKALGLDKAFTAIGIARLAAKSTGIVLNHGKAIIDMAGAQAMKYKEDKNIIADFRITLTNGKGSKSKFDDTKFAIRFDVNDCKWHATCLDNRKMKFPEEKLIKVALESEEGKKFKQYCLNRWKSIFAPEDGRRAIIPYILKNGEKLGLDSNKLSKEFINNIRKMSEKFDKIEAALK